MSDTIAAANQQQNTPSADDLDARLAADEAARATPEDTPEIGDQEAVQEAVQEPDEESEDKDTPKSEDDAEGLRKRNARLFVEKRKAEREAKSLKERLDRAEGKAPQLSPQEDEAQRIERRAAEIAANTAYNERANAIYRDGVKEYADFDAKLASFKELGGIPQYLVEAADEIGDPHKLIHYLGANPDEAERILGMTPHKMGAALGKIAAELAKPKIKPQSKAPAPIRPISAKSKADLSPEEMPIDQWMRQEDERVAEGRRIGMRWH